MNTSIKYIFTFVLALCALCAEAQMAQEPTTSYEPADIQVAIPQTSSATVNAPSVSDPSFQNANSMLGRRISISATYDQRNNNGVSGSSTVLPRRAKTLGGFTPSGASGLNPTNPFIGSHTDKGRLNPAGRLDMGGGSGNNGLGGHDGHRHPGELPIGNALIPLLLLLFGYAAFVIIRRSTRKEEKEA